MGLRYVGGTSGLKSTSSTTYTISLSGTLTGGIGSSPITGDIIIVASGFGFPSASAPAVSGNTSGSYSTLHAVLSADPSPSPVANYGSFRQIAGATPDTTLTITKGGTVAYGGCSAVHVWRNEDQTTPVDVTTVTATGTGTGKCDAPSIPPSTAGAVVIAMGFGNQPTTGGAFTIPSGMSNGVSVKDDGNSGDGGVWIASFAWTSGAYDPAIVTGGTTNSGSAWCAATVALRPLIHNGTGALTGPSSTIAGSAARFRAMDASGALAGAGSTIAGSATRFRAMSASGALVGQGGTVNGSAARFRAMATSGALVGPGAAISGTAARFRAMETSGALSGQGSSLAGVALRYRQLSTSGSLIGAGSSIVGEASRATTSVTHDASGALIGAGAVIGGLASRASGNAESGAHYWWVNAGRRPQVKQAVQKKSRQKREKKQPQGIKEQLLQILERKPIQYRPIRRQVNAMTERHMVMLYARLKQIRDDEDEAVAILLDLI